MIVIGSYAARLNGLKLRENIGDLDLIGTPAEAGMFRVQNARFIVEETIIHGHRHRFLTTPQSGFQMVEIDTEQSLSDRMLPDLCVGEAKVLDTALRYPPLEVLYLIKRAHANVPVAYDKAMADMAVMKPHLAPFTGAQTAFLNARKKECQDRYNLNRQRFVLSISNEEFFASSDHIRCVNHDDIHLAVAHTPGEPLYRKCKRDPTLARIDTDLFLALSPEDQLRMVREEFMVIGIERFYLHNPALAHREVYRLGMHKTIRDLFVGFFQDFCIDHAGPLSEPPPFDFVMRFNAAWRQGRVRPVKITIPPLDERHHACQALIDKGELGAARQIAEDLARRNDFGGDPHAYYLLGLIFFEQRDMETAENCIRKCLSRDRENGQAWLQLGVLRQSAGDNREAIQCFRKAMGLRLDTFDLHAHLGQALQNDGQTQEAAAAYARALQINPAAAPVRKRLDALKAAA